MSIWSTTAQAPEYERAIHRRKRVEGITFWNYVLAHSNEWMQIYTKMKYYNTMFHFDD